MPNDEASWITLEPGTGETLRTTLRRALRDAIRSGALRAGVRLPASRVLARQLGVSRGVVTDAYAQLEAEGFVVTQERFAPVVADVMQQPPRPAVAEPPEERARYDFTPTTPDVLLFPLRQWLAMIVAFVGGVKQYIQFLNGGVVGVAAKDGTPLWNYDKPANTTANISTPTP